MFVQTLPPVHPLFAAGGISDSHTHTTCSPDGHQSVAELCDSAAEKGLFAVCVTDHCDFIFEDDDNNQKQVAIAFDSFDQVTAQKEERFLLLRGVELGEALQAPGYAKQVVDGRPWDFVLGSLHNNQSEEDPYFTDFSQWDREDAQQLYERYLTQLAEFAEKGDYDSLAHMTYPIRYIVGLYHIPLDEEVMMPLYRRIMQAVIDRNKALEINTGGVRKPIGLPSPTMDLAKVFYDMGGRRITIGSDAHYVEHMGADIESVMEDLAAIGFAGITLFWQRTPYLLPFASKGE